METIVKLQLILFQLTDTVEITRLFNEDNKIMNSFINYNRHHINRQGHIQLSGEIQFRKKKKFTATIKQP